MSDSPSFTRREALRITAVAGVGVAVGGGALLALLRAGRLQRVRMTATRMGTLVVVTVVHPDGDAAREMVRAAFDEMDRLENVLSRHRPGTPVSRLNRDGAVSDAPLELREVLRRAVQFSSATSGAFDVTMAPLLAVHRTSFARTGEPPSDVDVGNALRRVGYRDLRMQGGSVAFARPGMSVSLDGIAKGYIVDRALQTLVEAGADRVTVDGGGDIASSGTPAPGDTWNVGIQDPWDPSGIVQVLHVRGGEGVATSGDYMQSFTQDRSHHHIIDPRTGRSPRHSSAVTVVAPTAMEADALSTAVLVLGPRAGIALLESLSGTEGLVISKEGDVQRTSGFHRGLA